ncbi:4Fe-4S dicluster domain-containing protein [Bacteroidota bacterium]
MSILFWCVVVVFASFFLFSSLTSFVEKEVRAGFILLLSLILFITISLLSFSLFEINATAMFTEVLILAGIIFIFFFPTKRVNTRNEFAGLERFHEADAVLSRRRLQPGSEEYNSYYDLRPEFRELDDKSRKNPGLLSKKARYYDPLNFSAASANFTLTELLHQLEDEKASTEKSSIESKEITRYISNWILQTGAHSVGITELKDYHLYSHKGRGKQRGEIITKDHSTAIAITVEMDYDHMKYAPAGPTVKESSEQYLRSGVIASKIALFIKNMGYDAKAHIDGNYELICPLVAEDAGLGVIGRMGLLMTPGLGPRVRIAVVTTNLPLGNTAKRKYGYMLDFCNSCKKCADTCPAQAIPSGPRKGINGAIRWKINSESCYNYWTLAGTDCGRCMIVCPFSHPDNWFHGFIRWGVKNNLLFRRMAVILDNMFYGRKPAIRDLPERLT